MNRTGRFAALLLAVSLSVGGVIGAAAPAGAEQARATAAAVTYGPYEFISNLSHLCMDVAYGSTADGARIQQWWCYGGPPEKWSMQFVERVGASDYFELVNQNSPSGQPKCLDLPYGDPTPGVALQLMPCWGGYMQLWAVETQSQTGTVQIRNLATSLAPGANSTCVDDTNWSNTPGDSLQSWPCNNLPPQQWYVQ